MIKEVGSLIEKITSLGAEVGGGYTIVILSLLIVSLCVLVIVRQNAKHNRLLNEDVKKVKEDQESCHEDRKRLEAALDASEKRGEELNSINKEAQNQIRECRVAHQATSKMLTDVVDRFLERIDK